MFAALSRIVDNVWYSKERSEVELNRKAGEDIWEVEREIHKEPVLAVPDLDKKMRMEVNMSDYAMGEVLLMECKDGNVTITKP